MVKDRNAHVTIRFTTEEKEALERLAEHADVSLSDFVRTVLLTEAPDMAKGIMYIFKFFEKYCKGANPDEAARDKFYDIIDLGEKMVKLYKGKE